MRQCQGVRLKALAEQLEHPRKLSSSIRLFVEEGTAPENDTSR